MLERRQVGGLAALQTVDHSFVTGRAMRIPIHGCHPQWGRVSVQGRAFSGLAHEGTVDIT